MRKLELPSIETVNQWIAEDISKRELVNEYDLTYWLIGRIEAEYDVKFRTEDRYHQGVNYDVVDILLQSFKEDGTKYSEREIARRAKCGVTTVNSRRLKLEEMERGRLEILAMEMTETESGFTIRQCIDMAFGRWLKNDNEFQPWY